MARYVVGTGLVLFFVWVSLARAGTGLCVQNGTQVMAQKVVYKQQGGLVEFSGDVLVQGQQFKLWCERLQVYLDKNGTAGVHQGALAGNVSGGRSVQIRKIIALGQVRVVMDRRKVWGDKAVYMARKQILTLQGHVLLEEDRNRITGEEVVVYLDKNVSEIKGGKDSRVEAVFFPGRAQTGEK